jgi:hypothetical protein
VRTTLTIDDDVAALLKREIRRSGEPMKQAINRCLRTALAVKATEPAPKFKVQSRKLGLLPGMSYDNLEAVLDQLDRESQK